jgi:hypothetical protein
MRCTMIGVVARRDIRQILNKYLESKWPGGNHAARPFLKAVT